MNLKDADITYKVRGKDFQSIKIVCLEEKETASMKVQEVVFGDFKNAEFPKSDFYGLAEKMGQLSIPFPDFSNGKGEDTHHLEIQSGENSIHLNWFGDSPGEGWKDVNDFVRAIVALKEKHLG